MREERRSFPRVATSVEVGVKHGDLPVAQTKSFDMSVGGIGLSSTEELPKRKVIDLEINLPASPISARGEVVWTKEVEAREGKSLQIGVRFTEMKSADKAKLKDFLNKV